MTLIDFLRQLSILLSLPAVVLMGMAAGVIVIVRDWRLALLAYAILVAILSVLLTQVMPPEWALLQAIVGGLVAVMLYMSARQLRGVQRSEVGRELRWPQLASLGIFRLFVIVLALMAFYVVRTWVVLPLVSDTLRDAIVWLVLAGMLGLALHEEPLHAGLALMTVLGGFTLLLFTLFQQRMLVGLLDAWQLLLGLAISYLTVSRGLAKSAAVRELPPFRWRR